MTVSRSQVTPVQWLRKRVSAWSRDDRERLHRPSMKRADAPDQVDHAQGLGRVEALRQLLGGPEHRGRPGRRPGCRPSTGGPPPWRATGRRGRARRPGAPAAGPGSGSQAPRIGSITLSPATADQHRSMRVRSSAETWVSSRVRNRYPRSRSRARCRSSATRADCGVVRARGGRAGTRMVRKQREPLVDVAADEELGRGQPLQLQGLRRGGPLGRLQVDARRPRRPGRCWPAHRPALRAMPRWTAADPVCSSRASR